MRKQLRLDFVGFWSLSLDSDPDGDQLIVVLKTAPTIGQVHLNSDGSFTYTPATGYVGSVSFVYELSDGHSSQTGTRPTGVVTLNVIAPQLPEEKPVPTLSEWVLALMTLLLAAAASGRLNRNRV